MPYILIYTPQIVIVCNPEWRDVFERRMAAAPKHIAFKWALPGAERQVGGCPDFNKFAAEASRPGPRTSDDLVQDSVFNGLQQIQQEAKLVAVHDSARPLVSAADSLKCFADAAEVGPILISILIQTNHPDL